MSERPQRPGSNWLGRSWTLRNYILKNYWPFIIIVVLYAKGSTHFPYFQFQENLWVSHWGDNYWIWNGNSGNRWMKINTMAWEVTVLSEFHFSLRTFLLFDSQKDKDPRKIPNYLLTSWRGVRMLIYSTFTKGHLQYIRLLSVCLSNRAITFLNIAIGI